MQKRFNGRDKGKQIIHRVAITHCGRSKVAFSWKKIIFSSFSTELPKNFYFDVNMLIDILFNNDFVHKCLPIKTFDA